MYAVILEYCVSCGACAIYCPMKAIFYQNGKMQISKKMCNGCGECIYRCIVRAIEMVDEKDNS